MDLFDKNYVFIFASLNFSHPQSTPHLMQYTHPDVFPLLKTVFDLVILMPVSAYAIFLFRLFHNAKTFSFEDFFHLGK